MNQLCGCVQDEMSIYRMRWLQIPALPQHCSSVPLLTIWTKIYPQLGSWVWRLPMHTFSFHFGWNKIPTCMSPLVFSSNRYAKWHHWHVYCWAWSPSQWSAHNCCCSPRYSIQGSTPYPCFFKSTSSVKTSTSWVDAWPVFRVLHQ